MINQLLITTTELASHLDDPNWLVVDCRFALSRPDEKEELYLKAHIPGAIYAHLDRDLSGPVISGQTGRHPLPAPAEATERFGRMGIGPGKQVVVYDDQGGSLAAVRLWLMLRWLGHSDAAVLDGSWQKWLQEDRPVESGRVTHAAQTFLPRIQTGYFANQDEVERIRLDPNYRLVDVRLPERYSGAAEPIDPVAGHIPGAINYPYVENLDANGEFRSPQELRLRYEKLLDGTPIEKVVFYCGSGVTSIHSLLAVEYAGLGRARIYPGSWSEWITDRCKPVALGSQAA